MVKYLVETASLLLGRTPESGERHIGLTVFGFENIAPEDRDGHVPDVGHYAYMADGDEKPIHTGVQCLTGNLDERPEGADGDFDDGRDRAFFDSTNINTDGPTSVSQAVDVGNYNGYACEWAYETSNDLGEDGDAMARGESEDIIQLHQYHYSSEWDAVADEFELDDRDFR